jgi:hypothetical protein
MHSKVWAIVTVLAILVALSAGVQTASADGGELILGGCMEDVYLAGGGQGNGLNCTANDIRYTPVTVTIVGGDGCDYAGDTATIEIDGEVILSAEARYDIGIYVATDGGDAYTGSCAISTIPYSPDPPYLDLDGVVSGTQDKCGDVDDPHDPLAYTLPTSIEVQCMDANHDGQLDLRVCTSWRQPGANDLCLGPLDAFPGAPSKCNCETHNVPVPVPPTVDLSLTKDVNNLSPNAGDEVIFTITVTNDGPDPAHNVEVEDNWSTYSNPTDMLSYVSDNSGGNYVYDPGTGTGIWTVGDLAVGDSATLNVTAKVEKGGSFLNWAEVHACDEVDKDSTPDNYPTELEDDDAEVGGGTPTAVTLSSFAAKPSAGGSASRLWLGLAGLAVAAGSFFWAKRRDS